MRLRAEGDAPSHETESAALDVLRSAGLVVDLIIWDGKIQRVPTTSKPRSKNGAYVAHPDPPVSIWWLDFASGQSDTWTDSNRGDALSVEERELLRKRMAESRKQRDEEQARVYADAAKRAQTIYLNALRCDDHPYIERKGVRTATGLKIHQKSGALIIPAYNEQGKISTLQFIDADGKKTFLTGGRKGGAYFPLGLNADDTSEKSLMICEGLATGLSLHECTGRPVFVAFDAGNLLPVAKIARAKFPKREIIMAADNDCLTDGNPGITKATEAAKAITNARVIAPHLDEQPVDWNDLHQAAGTKAVQEQIGDES